VVIGTTVLYTPTARPAGFPVNVMLVGVDAVAVVTVSQGTLGAGTEIPTDPGVLVTVACICTRPSLNVALRKMVEGVTVTAFCA
jgi:hypothetical protein